MHKLSFENDFNRSYARLRHFLKIHHQASFARNFLKLSLPSCCFHVGILFIFTALGIGYDKIYILHYQNKICGVFCWSDVITHNDYLLVIDISFSYKGWALGIVLRKANGSFFGNGLYQSDI